MAIWKGSHNQILRGFAITMGQLTTYLQVLGFKNDLKVWTFFWSKHHFGRSKWPPRTTPLWVWCFLSQLWQEAEGKCLGWDCKLMGRCRQMFERTNHHFWLVKICFKPSSNWNLPFINRFGFVCWVIFFNGFDPIKQITMNFTTILHPSIVQAKQI